MFPSFQVQPEQKNINSCNITITFPQLPAKTLQKPMWVFSYGLHNHQWDAIISPHNLHFRRTDTTMPSVIFALQTSNTIIVAMQMQYIYFSNAMTIFSKNRSTQYLLTYISFVLWLFIERGKWRQLALAYNKGIYAVIEFLILSYNFFLYMTALLIWTKYLRRYIGVGKQHLLLATEEEWLTLSPCKGNCTDEEPWQSIWWAISRFLQISQGMSTK